MFFSRYSCWVSAASCFATVASYSNIESFKSSIVIRKKFTRFGSTFVGIRFMAFFLKDLLLRLEII